MPQSSDHCSGLFACWECMSYHCLINNRNGEMGGHVCEKHALLCAHVLGISCMHTCMPSDAVYSVFFMFPKYTAYMYAMCMFCVTCLMQCYIHGMLSVLHSWYISYVPCYAYGMFCAWCMDCAMCLSVCGIPHSYCVHAMYIVFSLCARYMVYCVCCVLHVCAMLLPSGSVSHCWSQPIY